ncbi:Pkinase-domain-containing protein [Suhomyces tanzawaensis NRRL Y-17324]|uniref:Serine/threonine-protein kinase n=1 Tax=Suhomyces tanzawaensis NRRL Y-17324 TaxID=984487 RepID=A0A1E4SIX6_9ASCO|nr:Pkinase-domain-containing protein [Suhomyces tanzawaensis NRRL Y-17324]ODV79448.1 Pkinase-domain-containing protein [Suhomyces tanzawaensis NRRL Y-17324]
MSRAQPLQPLNNTQLNNRGNITPIKGVRRSKENQFDPVPVHGVPAAPPVAVAADKPKKKKEKLSALCKTPPSIVRTRNGRDYRRGNFLGEGGFARCFQMKDASGQIFAAKTVAKASIKNEKTKTKLLSEIKIHKSLKHANIVNFIDCFEDDVNVYILLEICPNQSLMELLKTRKRVSEPEVRYFMVQIIGAIKYLHSRRVIHRDLKLGNIFFDPQMNLKIGDFGLASVLPSLDSRKYTICGTPNYIAPEVLGGKNTGHSFEVDIWAIGIMMYALLVGKPPFQAKDVQVIYERIKKTEYAFPADKPISEEAKVLIKDLLSLNPLNRPTIDEILNYDWFKGPFPDKTYEESLVSTPPGFGKISKTQSSINFTNTKSSAGIYTPKNKNPVEILRSDLQSEQPKSLLPQSLSPNDTRNKYEEVNPSVLGKSNRRVNFNSNYSTTIKRLNQICFETYQNMRRLEYSKHEQIVSEELPRCENPILISKWVDYSNKYGFSYQLNNDDIGVLFNDENTILKVHNGSKFMELIYHENEGWTCIENSIHHPPSQVKRQLEIVDFFAKYMNSNLSKVSENEDRKETVFLRRYSRTSDYIMFEMTNGNFQFNFKDHHKICVSKSGLAITHISPSRIIQTHPLILVLKEGNFPVEEVPECLEKINVIKEAIKRKAFKDSSA